MTDIILWGRSMGAAAALMASPSHPLIRGIIVDSAYTSAHGLFHSISQKLPMPSMVRPLAVWWVKREVYSQAQFDCDSIVPSESGERSKVPLLLGHSQDDDFVPFDHALEIFERYGHRDKEMVRFRGGHNANRSQDWFERCVRFVGRVCGIDCHSSGVGMQNGVIEHAQSLGNLLDGAGAM
jgi:fermentation-respiration switch protein FrsA (DUF1100 family)